MGVRNMQPMVDGMNVFITILLEVHGAEVHPRVIDKLSAVKTRSDGEPKCTYNPSMSRAAGAIPQ